MALFLQFRENISKRRSFTVQYFRAGPCFGGLGPPLRKLKKGPPPKRLNLHIFAIGLNSHSLNCHISKTNYFQTKIVEQQENLQLNLH